MKRRIRIALASLRFAPTGDEALAKVDRALATAAKAGARIVCFPETYFPGLRGATFKLPPPSWQEQLYVLGGVCETARARRVAVIIGLERSTPKGLLNLAYVIDAGGRLLGWQAKNQITPDGEDRHYVPDGCRAVFDLEGVRIGIAICHEGWRYPETVRWAAVRGAQIVFQPQVTGSDRKPTYRRPGAPSFYEKAMVCRAQENSIYFVSVNAAMRYQNSASCVIAPNGERIAHIPRGRERVLEVDLDLTKANRRYAMRYRPELYPA